jgi:hypothetical protein
MTFPRRRFLQLGAGVTAFSAAPRLASADNYAPDQARLAVPAGRCVRHHRPPVGGQGEPDAWHGHRREQARCRRLGGCGCRGAFAARRLHDFSRQFGDSSRRHDFAVSTSVRSDEGFGDRFNVSDVGIRD